MCCERLLELCGKGNALSALHNTPVPADSESLFGGLTARGTSPYYQLGTGDTEEYTPDTDILLHTSHSEVPGRLQESSSPSSSDNANNSQEALNDATSTSSSLADNDDDDCTDTEQSRKEYKKAQKQAEEIRKIAEDTESVSDDVKSGRTCEVMDGDCLWEAALKMDCPAPVLQRIIDLKVSCILAITVFGIMKFGAGIFQRK